VKRGLIQEKKLREFCEAKKFVQHETLQLFRWSANGQWILYRRGTKDSQLMGPASQGRNRERYLGWTFSKSLGTEEETKLYKWVCLHHAAYDGLEERVRYAPRKKYEDCAASIMAHRIYIPANAQRSNFNPARGALIKSFTSRPR
jgi:hypothetical protein